MWRQRQIAEMCLPSQGKPRITREKAWEWVLLRASKENEACWQLDFELLSSRTLREYISVVLNCQISSSPRTDWVFPGGSDSKVRKIAWRREWQLTPVLLPGKFHEQRSLTSYSPWGHKELDTIDAFHTFLLLVVPEWEWRASLGLYLHHPSHCRRLHVTF